MKGEEPGESAKGLKPAPQRDDAKVTLPTQRRLRNVVKLVEKRARRGAEAKESRRSTCTSTF